MSDANYEQLRPPPIWEAFEEICADLFSRAFRDPAGFNGKEGDAEVGIAYYGARYYHPLLGRWLSPDPLAVHSAANNINPYAFASGAPSKHVDLNGLDDGSGCLGKENNCGGGGWQPVPVQGNGGGAGAGGGGGPFWGEVTKSPGPPQHNPPPPPQDQMNA